MLSLIRNSIGTRLLWGVLALHFLNISIDNPDPKPNQIPEDLSFNDQESIIEFILEKILGWENAIAEYDDPDADEENKEKRSKIEIVAIPSIPRNTEDDHVEIRCAVASRLQFHNSEEFSSIFSPPPEV